MSAPAQPTRVLIVIPAYNEEESLPLVARDLGALAGEAVVIDDGSFDRTAEVARANGLRTLALPFNLGIGGAVQTGLRYALEQGYGAAVQFDGDHQHRADQIGALVAPVLAGEADLAVGSRLLADSPATSPLRAAGGRFFSRLLRLLGGARATDPTSGFRCYGPRALEAFAGYYPEDYPEVESLLYAARLGLRVREVPVRMRPRGGGRSSIGALRAVYYMAKVSLGLLVGAVRSRAGWE